MTDRVGLGKDWLKRDRDTARVLGRQGGIANAAKRRTVRSEEYKKGYDNGWRQGLRRGRELYERQIQDPDARLGFRDRSAFPATASTTEAE